MKEALRELLKDTDRYIFMIKRSRINRESGQAQAGELTLFENDSIELDSALDPRLLRSRQAAVLLVDKDRGIAKVDITGRSWEVLQDSALLRERLIAFNSKLIKGGRARLISAGYVALVSLFPLWSSFVLFIAWTVSSARNRYLFYNSASSHVNPNPKQPFPVPPPHWLGSYFKAVIFLWPVFLFISLAMGSVRLMGGGLRVWPESLTLRSAAQAFYRIRISTFTAGNASTVIIGVITAVIASLLTYLIIH
jgi:hypothetical protein